MKIRIKAKAIAQYLSNVIKSCYGITSVPKSSIMDYAGGLVGFYAFDEGVIVRIKDNKVYATIHVVVDPLSPVSMIIKNLRESLDYAFKKLLIKNYEVEVKVHVSQERA
ncbi:Asp23/Gls24 family envelope stress response protein [Coprothermobacter platensis]|uniref:Asp23/Gls24 family envelope stress response protein n=1 Tax=Coprothermobacter platensis TaxID=108819 RepID=UPI000371D1C0|nr:Asp23/Gls24 family envelope stress response protein [Coprothermobacter platensis]